MTPRSPTDRILSGVRNFDDLLKGGIPRGEIIVLAGPPGSGKTILSQQLIFNNASAATPAIIFQTLSEPTAKNLCHLKQFTFFDQQKLDNDSIRFVDLGEIMRAKGLAQTIELFMAHIKTFKPAFVVVDSFKVFEDLANSQEELRKFTYEMVINLMVWECTALFLGEFNQKDLETNPLFSIIDGIVSLQMRLASGEQQRFIQVVKMRGSDHSREPHSFEINAHGIEIYSPRITIQRVPTADKMVPGDGPRRARTGVSNLDSLLGEGIPYGSSLLVSGVAGTGKTLLLLEFIYRGARDFGERGIFFSFEETRERIISNARGMGWEIDEEIQKGNIEIIFIPQPEIMVEKHLQMMKDSIERLRAKRIAIDSSSVFVHKLSDSRLVQEKIFQLATLVQVSQAVGFFASDIPYGSTKISRFGVEETVVDGVILLTATNNERDLTRERYIEVYKLRNTAHVNGRHRMDITKNGIVINDARGPT